MRISPLLGRCAVLSLGFTALFLGSCATSNPQSRIQRRPELFARLSTPDQELVQKGGIRRGMHKDGVYIAWGAPASRVTGNREGKQFDLWRYTKMRPVFIDHFAYYGGYGYGRYHHGRYRGGYFHDFGYYPTVEYIPYVAAVVRFENNRVKSWEQER